MIKGKLKLFSSQTSFTKKQLAFPNRSLLLFHPPIVPHVHGRRAQWRCSPNYTQRDVENCCSSAGNLPSCRFHTDQFSGSLRCAVNHPTLVPASRAGGGGGGVYTGAGRGLVEHHPPSAAAAALPQGWGCNCWIAPSLQLKCNSTQSACVASTLLHKMNQKDPYIEKYKFEDFGPSIEQCVLL